MNESNGEKRTEIGEIGEFGLIDQLASQVSTYHDSTIKGIGDDAAAYAVGDELVLISTDMLVEGIHFDLSYAPLQHLGYKAVAVNISDIAAMNGTPKQITVSLGLTSRFSVEAVEALYEGIRTACDAYKVDLVGGDTTSSRSGLIISITAIGSAKKGEVAYRDGAQNKDIVCVTGDLGGAYAGLQVLAREKQEYLANPDMQPQLDKYSYVVGRQLRPKARMDIIHEFRDLGIVPTSMIDISDGLASELFHICKSSGLGVAIYEDKLPIDQSTYETAAEFSIDPNTCAMNGGEDYELLFTIRQDDFEKIKNHPDIHTIGYMHEADRGKVMVTRNNNTVALQAQGWKHF
ncbi:thiamine-phosphate kinase [Marinoscillum sp. MHG1-6]|uniref:thiamine-phosphate kinase n=1 Tax=Marinoscillum sp. MHG1-6 TaxID=2959627 RepID=UPI0021588052|nr:thiamine-phosphate kinase [Marinoscillum sp. MHG1-6]